MKPKQKELVERLVVALEARNQLERRRIELGEKIAAALDPKTLPQTPQ